VYTISRVQFWEFLEKRSLRCRDATLHIIPLGKEREERERGERMEEKLGERDDEELLV